MLKTVIVACLVLSVQGDGVIRFNEIIEKVNSAHSTWTAGHNFEPIVDRNLLKHLNGAQQRNESLSKLTAQLDIIPGFDCPTEFDARKHWKNCPSIRHIGDQGRCSSDWAMAVSDAFSDRICIATKGQNKLLRSAYEMLSCCRDCLDPNAENPNPCEGGSSFDAWNHLISKGLASGGVYSSKSGCQPYQFAPCWQHPHLMSKGKKKKCEKLPKSSASVCKTNCLNKKYKKHDYVKDHIYSNGLYSMHKPSDAQQAIFTTGPITATFTVYEDFFAYKSGIYQHVTGNSIGLHSVRVIGWGTDNGVPYWLAANTWNKNWGDSGVFKIQRLTNECGFEDNLLAGDPALSQ